MKKIEKYTEHLEYNGYQFYKEMGEDEGRQVYYFTSEQYGPLSICGIGKDASLGVRLEKYYPLIVSNKQKIEFYEMINEINKSLAIGACFWFDDGGLMMSFPILGDYNKKNTSNILEAWHVDCEKIFEFELQKYWKE